MSIRGSLKTMPVPDLLDWIDRREMKGQLALKRANITRKLQVAYGCINSASSDNPAEYLAQLLVNAGEIDEEALRDAFARAGKNGLSLGRTLLDEKLVTPDGLADALTIKIRESVYDMLSWEDGTFVFDPDVTPPRTAEVEIAVPLRDCMLEGQARADEWKVLRALIPTDAQRFWMPDPKTIERADPASDEARLLGSVLAGMTVRDVILDHHSLPFPIYQKLADLIRKGWIKLDRRGGSRSPGGTINADPEGLIAAARGRASGGDRDGALALAKQALDKAPADEKVRKAYQELERALFADLTRTLLSKYRVPRLLKRKDELSGIELSPEERYFVGRIDGRWDLLSLMRVSPLREVEALITLQKLAKRGVISLE